MQLSLIALFPVLLASISTALPSGTAPRTSISKQQLADAQNKWRADTSAVSQFLSAVPSLSGRGGAQLAAAARVALDAENDELAHKAVLDAAFLGSDARVAAADDVLVAQGTFQAVVDALALFARDGASMAPSEVAVLLRRANAVRCARVLPAIDAYFRVAGEALHNGGFLLATRPDNC
ncbi:hypothetical protein SAMD00023353_0103470 [Rosellinia necatrix]|uniref:Uncharacterized protein n=1 Tax=Rosellinia necatrix TaxID=77044 RepID=A0A1S7UIP0_ROSNE|nr:hypothetical protein SAMD00023353_0103470 [Rosellinia necatrix]